MWMSVIIGGSAVLGGAVAGALSDENTDVLIDAIVEERKK
jgi:Trk K+ transport system NAD-binding subunit